MRKGTPFFMEGMECSGRVLVTGAGGFVARALLPLLLEEGWSVTGLVRRRPDGTFRAGVDLICCDLTGPPKSVGEAVEQARPDAVVHLAASVPGHGGADASSLLDTNVRATENLLVACARLSPKPRVVIASSSAVYGPGKPGTSLSERRSFRPVSYYGISKVIAEMLALRAAGGGLPAIRARLFNVVGPGQGENLVVAAFARRIASIEAGLRPPEMEVGSMESYRDFVDVRDAAAALALLIQRGCPGGVYNVCSGRATKIRKVLNLLILLAGLKGAVRIRERQGEPDPTPYQRGSAARIRCLGWRTRYELRRTLADVLEFWRAKVGD